MRSTNLSIRMAPSREQNQKSLRREVDAVIEFADNETCSLSKHHHEFVAASDLSYSCFFSTESLDIILHDIDAFIAVMISHMSRRKKDFQTASLTLKRLGPISRSKIMTKSTFHMASQTMTPRFRYDILNCSCH